jgi:hypothetical protein
MKAGKILTTAVGATLLFSSSAFAVRHEKQTTKGTLHLSEEVTVEGKQLAPGDYKVKTENTGSQTTVDIMQGKTMIVSLPAQTKPADVNESHAYMTTDEPNGAKELTAVFLKGTEYKFLDQNTPQPEGQ